MTTTAVREPAPILDPSILAPLAELALPTADELRALDCTQMRDRCRSLARAGQSEPEIAAALRWSLDLVRGALSQGPIR